MHSTFATVFILILASTQADKSTLKFVQVFFRHGQRTPTHYLTFPTDPPDTAKQLPYECGELTNTGKWQEYSLGANLRNEYAALIDYKYRPSQLRIFTGLDNRTTASAQLALAGFLPPRDDQIWNSALLWQPIPTVTAEIIDHVSFGLFDHCDKLGQQIVNADNYWSIFDSLIDLTKFLETKTGLYIPDLYVLQRVIDSIISRDSLRYLMPFPKWADSKSFLSYIRKVQHRIHIDFMATFLEQIGGWHYDQIVGGMEDFINERSKHRIVMYSGHDTNTVTLSEFLKLNASYQALPNFASFLAFELHKIDGEFHVKVFFHNELNQTKHELHLNDCPVPCRFERFANLGYRRTSSNSWMLMCQHGIEAECAFYQSLSGVFLVISVILAASFFSTLWSCLSYRKKYRQLSDPETRPLL